jgi:hypothetical protein
MNQVFDSRRKIIRAFTRLELIGCVAAVMLLIIVVLPALANSGARSDRVTCLNNLRQIGVAYSHFGLEEALGRPPWRLPMALGGNSDHPLKNNLYIQLALLSNSLSSPSVLKDPADRRPLARVARYWDNRAEGGLHHPNFRNRAVSYPINLDADFRLPQAVLSADRHFLAAPNATGCSSGLSPAAELRPWTTGWTNDVHGLVGNVVSYDGSVAEVDSAGLRSAFTRSPLDIAGSGMGAIHLLAPF